MRHISNMLIHTFLLSQNCLNLSQTPLLITIFYKIKRNTYFSKPFMTDMSLEHWGGWMALEDCTQKFRGSICSLLFSYLWEVNKRKSALKNVYFPICLHLLGCSSSLLSTHLSVIWCALLTKVCDSAECSSCCTFPLPFTLTLSLYISLIFSVFLFFLSVGCSQLSSGPELAVF